MFKTKKRPNARSRVTFEKAHAMSDKIFLVLVINSFFIDISFFFLRKLQVEGSKVTFD